MVAVVAVQYVTLYHRLWRMCLE